MPALFLKLKELNAETSFQRLLLSAVSPSDRDFAEITERTEYLDFNFIQQVADSFIVSLPSRLFICIRVNRKKYKSCYDDVLESLQGCRRFKEKMYKNWMNGVQNASE